MTITVYVYHTMLEQFIDWVKNPDELESEDHWEDTVKSIVPNWGKWVHVNLTVDEWHIVNDNFNLE